MKKVAKCFLSFSALVLFAVSGLAAMGLFHSTAVAQETKLTDAQKWALATPAIVKKLNEMDMNVLGGGEADPDYENSIKEMLANDWGVTNRENGLEILQWLRDEGHRAEYDAMAVEIAKGDDKAFDALMQENAKEPEIQAQLKFVREHMKATDKRSILAWDYCRLVYLAECIFRARHITESEAWGFIMPAALALQERFSSWEELGDNYLIGREFWGGGDMNLFSETRKELCADPESPWVKLPWKTSLAESAAK